MVIPTMPSSCRYAPRRVDGGGDADEAVQRDHAADREFGLDASPDVDLAAGRTFGLGWPVDARRALRDDDDRGLAGRSSGRNASGTVKVWSTNVVLKMMLTEPRGREERADVRQADADARGDADAAGHARDLPACGAGRDHQHARAGAVLESRRAGPERQAAGQEQLHRRGTSPPRCSGRARPGPA